MLGLFLFFVPSLAFAQQNEIVKSVRVEGNDRVDTSTIMYYIKTEKGKPLNQAMIRKDIEQIYSLGQFSDIRVDTFPSGGGVEVVYVVEEIPSIGDVNFVGNDQVENKDLREGISLRRGATFKDHLVQDTIEKIRTIYHEKGYFFAEIKVDTKPARQGLVDVDIRIREGNKVRIEKIRFSGAKSLDEDDLKEEMETQESTWYSFLDDSGIYKKDILKLDMLRLEAYYQDHGFLKVRVQDPKIDINKKDQEIYITIPIQEGQRYRVGKIKLNGDETYTEEELGTAVKLKEGEVYNVSQLRKDILSITELYSVRGYAYADVVPSTEVDDEKRIVDVEVKVNPGRKVYVGEINILGNVKTRDNVIRREFRLKEGEVFNSALLKRSKQRINNLQYFEDVKVDTRRGREPDLIDVVTTLTERPTGSISVGAGFSSVENLIFTGSITQNNLFGRGQTLNFSTDLSSIRRNFNLNFTDPRILDTEVTMGIDLYNRTQNFFSFDTESTGGGLRFGKTLTEYDWVGIGYRYENAEVTNINPVDVNPNFFNQSRSTSRITPSYIRDTRDNFLNPTRGIRHVARFEVSGGILGGASFTKTGYEVSYYHPIIGKLTGAVHGEVNFGNGFEGEELPLFERYFMGGASSLRGYTVQQVGPKSIGGDPLGGDQSLLFNAELIYPLTKEFRAFVFYDRGNVYGSGPDLSTTSEVIDFTEMRQSIGAGIRFISPFGPVGLAYGFKLDKAPTDTSGEFHFSAGSAF